MNDYFIQSIKNIVSVHRIINCELEIIKINGDSHFPICDFWPLFMQKIEYEADEQLAFVVLSDEESFQVDSKISLSEIFVTPEIDIRNFIFDRLFDGAHLITFPKLKENFDVLVPRPRTQTKVSVDTPEITLDGTGDNIQSYYRKKTRSMQRKSNEVIGGK